MAKKKELPKAMSGGIKPLIRAVVATGKVTGKATVRGGKANYKSFVNTPIKGPVSFFKVTGEGVKAGAKGFSREIKSGIKTEKAKAAERVVANKAKVTAKAKAVKTPPVSEEKRLMDELNAMKDKKTIADKKIDNKPVKKPMSKRKKIAIVVGTAAAAAGIKYATRDRRTLND